jgi:hypothetical protein
MSYLSVSQSSLLQPSIKVLKDEHQGFDTGAMGACVTVVVLHDKSLFDNEFGEGQAQHGSGGLSAINFTKLTDDVPKDEHLKVVIVPGPTSGARKEPEKAKNIVVSWFSTHGYNDAKVSISAENFLGAFVDRFGVVTNNPNAW